MPCEKCPERRAMYCADADLTLCPLCYETWADEHAAELDLSVPRSEAEHAARKLAVGLESPLLGDPDLLAVVNSPLTKD